MGKVASELADFSIITSDNPRSEDPAKIAQDIIVGFKNDNYKILLDRNEAIRSALSIGRGGDIILIAGKGHESYQIFKNKTVTFNDKQVVWNFINKN